MSQSGRNKNNEVHKKGLMKLLMITSTLHVAKGDFSRNVDRAPCQSTAPDLKLPVQALEKMNEH
jgi:hypothetical protein